MRPCQRLFTPILALLALILSYSGCVASSPAVYSLADFQTPIRNQSDRETCWAFASVAALEAAYKREYGLELDLSEQYVIHIIKAGELYPDYLTSTLPHENNSSNWDYQGNSDSLLKMMRFAVPLETVAPYLDKTKQARILQQFLEAAPLNDFTHDTQEQLDTFEFAELNIPTPSRYGAVYQVTDAAMLEDISTDGLEQMISQDHEVVGEFNLKWKKDPVTGSMDWDPLGEDVIHLMLVVGYDRTLQTFTLKNSRGGQSLTQVTYKFVENALKAASYIKSIRPIDLVPAPGLAPTWLGRWKLSVGDRQGELWIRRFTDFRDGGTAPTKLGGFYEGGQSFDVEGHFEDGASTLVFTIAGSPGRVQPGVMIGKAYRIYFNESDPDHLTGPELSTMTRDREFPAPATESPAQ